jgi:HEPN domain-containing protein
MNKLDYIEYWKRTAADSWIATQALFNARSYVESVFWAHLTLEKLLKAHWVQDNATDIAPRIHNLVRLANETTLVLDVNQQRFLLDMNSYQMDSRYPDYSFSIETLCTPTHTQNLLTEVDIFKTWLLNQLP